MSTWHTSFMLRRGAQVTVDFGCVLGSYESCTQVSMLLLLMLVMVIVGDDVGNVDDEDN